LQDLPSQPRDEPTNSCTTSLSAAASRRGSGGGEASTARCSTPFIISISILAGAQVRTRRFVDHLRDDRLL
jgi:hypothetical protein